MDRIYLLKTLRIIDRFPMNMQNENLESRMLSQTSVGIDLIFPTDWVAVVPYFSHSRIGNHSRIVIMPI